MKNVNMKYICMIKNQEKLECTTLVKNVGIGEKLNRSNKIFQSEGEYPYGIHTGNWKFINDCEIIFDDSFNNAECEQNEYGQWKEIFSFNQKFYNFRFNFSQQLIVQEGQYMNNERIDQWYTFYRKQLQADQELIGQGNYDKKGKKSLQTQVLLENKTFQIILIAQNKSIQKGYYYENNLKVEEQKRVSLYEKINNTSFHSNNSSEKN